MATPWHKESLGAIAYGDAQVRLFMATPRRKGSLIAIAYGSALSLNMSKVEWKLHMGVAKATSATPTTATIATTPLSPDKDATWLVNPFGVIQTTYFRLKPYGKFG